MSSVRPSQSSDEGEGGVESKELLFEYFATVSLIPESLNSPRSTASGQYEADSWMPVVADRYPLEDTDFALPEQLALFCLPHNEQPVPIKQAHRHPPKFFPIVLTDAQGQRLFGSCLLRYMAGSSSYCETLLMPHVSCLLSKTPLFELGRELLVELFLLTSDFAKKPPPSPYLSGSVDTDMPKPHARTSRYLRNFSRPRTRSRSVPAAPTHEPPHVPPPEPPPSDDRLSSYTSTSLRALVSASRMFSISASTSTASSSSVSSGGASQESLNGTLDLPAIDKNSGRPPSAGIETAAPPAPAAQPAIPLERYLVNFVREAPLPDPGSELHMYGCGDRDLRWRHGASPSPLPYVDDSAFCVLFQLFSASDVVGIVEALLAEKKTVIVADDMSVLAPICEALLALLWPFRWQHIYIPVLPVDMAEYLEAPVPFLMGVSTQLLDHLGDEAAYCLEDAVRVEANMGTVCFPSAWLDEVADGQGGEGEENEDEEGSPAYPWQFPEPHRTMLIDSFEQDYLQAYDHYLAAFPQTTGSFYFSSSTKCQLKNPLALDPHREHLVNRPNNTLGIMPPQSPPKHRATANADSSLPRPLRSRSESMDQPSGAWIDLIRLGFLDMWCQLLTAYKEYMRPSQLPELSPAQLAASSIGSRRGSVLVAYQSRSVSIDTTSAATTPEPQQELRHGFEAESFIAESPRVYRPFLESLVGTQQFLNLIEDTCDAIQTGEVHEDLEFFDRLKGMQDLMHMKSLVVRGSAGMAACPVLTAHRVNTLHVPLEDPGQRFVYSEFPRLDYFMVIKPRDPDAVEPLPSAEEEKPLPELAAPPSQPSRRMTRRMSMRREGTVAATYSRTPRRGTRSISVGSADASADGGGGLKAGKKVARGSRTAFGKAFFPSRGGPLERLPSAKLEEEGVELEFEMEPDGALGSSDI